MGSGVIARKTDRRIKLYSAEFGFDVIKIKPIDIDADMGHGFPVKAKPHRPEPMGSAGRTMRA